MKEMGDFKVIVYLRGSARLALEELLQMHDKGEKKRTRSEVVSTALILFYKQQINYVSPPRKRKGGYFF